MASASSSSGFEPTYGRKYDVFISFRGKDTRFNFTSHLRAALKRASLMVFLDDGKLEKGEEIAASLIQAIRDSTVSLVVFSQNYASSKWCLDELAHIMKYREEEGQFVIPIFYKVDPSHVRYQIGPYKEAFEKHETRHDHESVTRWTAALSEAANISGRHYIQTVTDENNLIEEIVSDVNKKLKHIYKCKCASKGLFGMVEMIEPIEVLLQRSHKVGIWGMGGLGKTTMAKEVFGKLSSKYRSRCLFENVRETIQRNGMEHVRNSLVWELLGEDISSHALRDIAYVTTMLQRKKALVVLDDVNDSVQLMDLEENIFNHLGVGSKVIITTRNQQLLKANEYELHEAKLLSYDNARQLFINKAFGQGDSRDGYGQLIERFVEYTKHLPLALKILGSCVRSKEKNFWDDVLKKLRDGSPNEVVQRVLRVSYDGLDNEVKKIFLDIACFLKGESEDYVKELLQSYRFHSTSGIETLKDKALIIVTTGGEVEIHDLIQEMGHQIVREENINEPEKRSRLWDPNEIYNVLKKCEGKNVEGIMMNFHSIKHLELAATTFNNMKKLRFLKFYTLKPWERDIRKISVPTTGLQSISSEIMYFHWEVYPGKSLPSNFCAELLLELNLEYSQVETLWEGMQDLPNLRRLNLCWCKKLRELPDFSKACKLESIDLSNCESLREVPESLLHLHSLISLDVSWCVNLESLQSGTHLKSLKQVKANGCLKLKEFSLSSEELTCLDLRYTRIEELRSSIQPCSKLRTLSLPAILELKNLPKEEFSSLASLENLEISTNDTSGDDIEGLHELFDRLHSLRTLCLTNLWALKELPDNITQLSGLKELQLEFCVKLTKLPDNMRLLSHLEFLSLKWCYELQSALQLPPSLRKLNVIRCESLERVTISSTAVNSGDKLFSFDNCDKLDVGSFQKDAMKVLRNAVQEKKYVTISYTGNRTQHEHGSHTLQLSLSSSHNLLGFVFHVVSESYWKCYRLDVSIIDEGGEYGFHIPTFDLGLFPGNVNNLMSRPEISKSILEKIEAGRSQGGTAYNPILSFNFFDSDGPIRESGVYPIYASQCSHFNVYSRKRKTMQ